MKPVSWEQMQSYYRIPLIKLPGVTLYRAAYTRKHLPLFAADAILKDPIHPLFPQTQQRYNARSRATLWWNVTSNTTSANPKRVVKSWNNRRLRRAVVEGLEANGLDAEGRVVGEQVEGLRSGLSGTFILYARSAALTADFQELRMQIGLVLQEILWQRAEYRFC